VRVLAAARRRASLNTDRQSRPVEQAENADVIAIDNLIHS